MNLGDAVYLAPHIGYLVVEGGIQLSHVCLEGRIETATLPFAYPGAMYYAPCVWDVVRTEPLTLVPSIACPNGCGFWGHITNGKWVPA